MLLLGLTLQVKAQYFEHDLRSHKWLCTDGFEAVNIFDWYLTFTEGKVNFTMKDKDTNNVVSNFDYKIYLVTNNSETRNFDNSLVGKDLFGKFIVMDREKKENDKVTHDTNVAEILSMTPDNLVLFLNNKNKLTFKAVE